MVNLSTCRLLLYNTKFSFLSSRRQENHCNIGIFEENKKTFFTQDENYLVSEQKLSRDCPRVPYRLMLFMLSEDEDFDFIALTSPFDSAQGEEGRFWSP